MQWEGRFLKVIVEESVGRSTSRDERGDNGKRRRSKGERKGEEEQGQGKEGEEEGARGSKHRRGREQCENRFNDFSVL